MGLAGEMDTTVSDVRFRCIAAHCQTPLLTRIPPSVTICMHGKAGPALPYLSL